MHTIVPGPERRHLARMRCLKAGRVVLANGNSTLDCRIRNQSPNGVRLAVDETALVPDTFPLMHEPAPGKPASHMCRIAWRSANEIGATIVGENTAKSLRRIPRTNTRAFDLRYPV